MKKNLLSVVLPAFNEEESVKVASKTIQRILRNAKIPYELIFVDDGSKDDTWQEICRVAKRSKSVGGVSFSRNFGKESAIMAGLAEARGNCCVVMDCDLQHPPEKIVEMYRLWQKGYEIVEGVKADRGHESLLYKGFAKLFYGIMSRATDTDMSRSSDFKLLDRKAVVALLNIRERNAFFRAMSSWIGFKTTSVEYEVQERVAGKSKWNSRSLCRYALTNIMSFTTIPMQIVTFLGVVTLIGTTIFTVISLIQKLSGAGGAGFTTVIALQGFTSSVIMISLGIIGFYIAKIYDEVKARPRYIIVEKTYEETGKSRSKRSHK